MRTAMQEVLLLVEQMYKDAKSIMVESAMNDVINIITQEGLPKEKEQIMNAFSRGLGTELSDWENSQQYYDRTYNQNK